MRAVETELDEEQLQEAEAYAQSLLWEDVVAARNEVTQLLPTSAGSLAPAITTIPVADLDFVPLPPLPEAASRQPPVVPTTIPEVVEPLSLPSSDPVALDIPQSECNRRCCTRA